MSINDCPHCGKPAVGFWGKSLLGPARTAKCIACGQRISVSWSSMWVIAPLIAAFILLDMSSLTGAAYWGGLLAALAGSMVLYWYFARLVPR